MSLPPPPRIMEQWEEHAHRVMNEESGSGWMEGMTASEHKTELHIQDYLS